ncbi:hypothetical protein [Gracilimonas mengyeensis]|uniref:Uncharacterized protein n=1 Tax=Gracilimonas mengyeensis TaxID=1302730 RepID=A0A521FM10_9BACT|nr:hypothetical protein [Gracilimonas mengyeensis]SMO97149.1 hypothetical protein SAMN06265219_12312 [Gracilimonas mengyeensis]
MSASTFWRTVISGCIATFVMTMIAFLQGGLGLPVIDVGHILTQSFNHIHTGEPYSLIWGNLAYNITGVLLALIWVAFLQERIPGNRFIQGVLYGVLVSVVAGGVISPFVSMAAGDSFGFFYTNTWIPGKVLLAGLTMHLGYGLTLMLCMKVAGVGKK